MRKNVWVSELNARQDVRARFQRPQPVRFYDTTLRDGEQTVGVVLDPQQKLEIAYKLDELGIGRIEAGFPKVSAEDAEAIQLMTGRRFSVWEGGTIDVTEDWTSAHILRGRQRHWRLGL